MNNYAAVGECPNRLRYGVSIRLLTIPSAFGHTADEIFAVAPLVRWFYSSAPAAGAS